MGASSPEITILLKAWSDGDQAALAQLTQQVYPELRLMARRYMKNERKPNTLQATALVHEVTALGCTGPHLLSRRGRKIELFVPHKRGRQRPRQSASRSDS